MIVTLNIPAEEVSDLTDFLCDSYNYTATIYDPLDPDVLIDNPESRGQFSRRVVMNPLKEGFDQWLIRRAIKASDITSNIEIISVTT
jgi:hypothetical protein